eukprot:366082-Chlamydomonas_euryale.AAC.30
MCLRTNTECAALSALLLVPLDNVRCNTELHYCCALAPAAALLPLPLPPLGGATPGWRPMRARAMGRARRVDTRAARGGAVWLW